jgi:hypothetical protein
MLGELEEEDIIRVVKKISKVMQNDELNSK